MAQQIDLDSDLARFLQKPGWELCPSRRWMLVKAPSKREAHHFTLMFGDVLAAWTKRFNVYVNYGNKIFEIPNMTNSNQRSFLQFSQSPRLTLPLLRVAEEIMNHPEQSLGIVRVADQAQMAVNGGQDGRYLFGADPLHYSQLKRHQYWNAEDLRTFNLDWPRRLDINSENWSQFRYRVRYPSPGKDLNGPDDTLMICDFRLIDDGFGNLYHLGRNVGMEAISP